MSTFYGIYGSAPMLASVAVLIDKDVPKDVDIHTITLTLGQHGEYDLVVLGNEDLDNEEVRFEGIAHRAGGVEHFHRVEA